MRELSSFFCNREKLESRKKVCENKDLCSIIMLSEDTKIIEFDKYQKPDKVQFVIYADLENLIDKIDGCKSNSENSSPTKLGKHILSCFLTSTILSFISIENKHDVYIGKDCMKKFCESLRERAMKIINSKKIKNEVIDKRAALII